MKPGTWIVALALGLPSALPAAVEPQISDLRLVLEGRPTRFSYEWRDARRSGGGDDAFDTALAAGLGARWGLGAAGRPHRLLLGLDLLATRDQQDALDQRGWLLRAGAGWAVGLDDRWTFALLPTIGLTRARAVLSTGSTADFALSGGGWEAAASAGLRWSIDRRWSLALDAGWNWSRASLDGDGASLDLRRDGPSAALALGWTIDPTPRPLGER